MHHKYLGLLIMFAVVVVAFFIVDQFQHDGPISHILESSFDVPGTTQGTRSVLDFSLYSARVPSQ